MNVKQRLNELDLEVPEPSTPGGNYSSVNIRNKIAYVSIQFPIKNGEYLYVGQLGSDLTTEDGYEALKLSALNVISQINDKVGFEKVLGLNHIDIYYQSASSWDDAPKVADGASDLFVDVLLGKGKHTRSLLGVSTLPRGFCCGLVASFTLI
jgi:enamine deaminase RidA (YjgF/YER057c/UK114 family)